jgi:hypothetical protein
MLQGVFFHQEVVILDRVFIARTDLIRYPDEARARIGACPPYLYLNPSRILANHNAAAQKAGRQYDIPSIDALFRRDSDGKWYYEFNTLTLHPEDIEESPSPDDITS